MTSKKIRLLFIFLCFCFLLMPYQIMAASSTDAAKPIMSEKDCSLTVSYCYGETTFSGVSVKLYKVADFTADYRYTPTQNFAIYGLDMNGIQNQGEWNVIRSTLESHILANSIGPDMILATDADGKVCFDAIEKGMYLAVVDTVICDDLQYQFDSALVAVPGRNQDGSWYNTVSVNAKGEMLPPAEPEEETELKVLKLWRGDENREDRPENVKVEIFCNGVSYQTVTLSENNHWAYTWSAKNDGSKWTVIERDIPEGYTMTVEERQATFVLTNTRTPEVPDEPVKPPQTGDTTNILLYILLMVGSGSMLIVLGVIGKKARL